MTEAAWTTLRESAIASLRRCLPARFRTMKQFAEQEVVIPNGPYAGRYYNTSRQPYAGPWFDLVDSGIWNRFFATGCTQSGKTLSCFIIPAMYHLFEIQETVIILVPQMEMAKDKWNEDLLPAIEKSRYRYLLPTSGGGSKGGVAESIRFKNGVTLKFMSGGGSDKKRSAFTSRVVIITEVDGMDVAGESSREADKITQVESRTLAYGDDKRIYGECTVSIEQGRTWQEYTKGTATRLVVECHACKSWVTPEREDLFGWHDAENVIESRERGQFACPTCGVLWNEQQRAEMNRSVKVLHRGQEVQDGQIVGEFPQTDTLGYRWNAFNNLFWLTADIAAGEWKASKADNPENAEKEQLQFKWAKPYKPDVEASIPIDVKLIMARAGTLKQGDIPATAIYLSAAIDLGMYYSHWVLLAGLPGGAPQLIDCGVIEVHSKAFGVERALLMCLQEFKDMVEHGWPRADGSMWIPDRALIDSGYQSDVVYEFVRDYGGGRFWAADGRGEAQDGKQGYSHPHQMSAKVLMIGEQYFVGLTASNTMLVAIDANYWKSWVHKRLTTPVTQPGAMTLFKGEGNTHLTYAKHLTAERQMTVFKAGKGNIDVWERQHKQNHWFDGTYYASVGLHMAGARLIAPKPLIIETKPQEIETNRPFVRQVELSQESGGWIRRRAK